MLNIVRFPKAILVFAIFGAGPAFAASTSVALDNSPSRSTADELCKRPLQSLSAPADPLSFMQQAPEQFFASVAIEIAVDPNPKTLSLAMILIPANLSLWAETFLSDTQLSRQILGELAIIRTKPFSQRPRTDEQFTSRIDAYLSELDFALPPLSQTLAASLESRRLMVDAYFETESPDGRTAAKEAEFLAELTQRVHAGYWPRARGVAFQNFMDQAFALQGHELTEIYRFLVLSWVHQFRANNPNYLGLGNVELVAALATQFGSEEYKNSDLRPFFIGTVLSVLSDVRVLSGLRLKAAVVNALSSREAQAAWAAQVRRSRLDAHLARVRSANEKAFVVTTDRAVVPTTSSTSDVGPESALAADPDLSPIIAKSAAKDREALQPAMRERFDEFLALASQGARALEQNLRRQPGSWALTRLHSSRLYGDNMFVVRLSRQVRLGFRVIPNTNQIEIVAANTKFGRNSED